MRSLLTYALFTMLFFSHSGQWKSMLLINCFYTQAQTYDIPLDMTSSFTDSISWVLFLYWGCTVYSQFLVGKTLIMYKALQCFSIHQLLSPADPYPVYLGVTLDRTLSYREHLSRSAAKLKSRNNLIAKIAGTSWGASASTLHTSALALCYSVAEYCCPVVPKINITSVAI